MTPTLSFLKWLPCNSMATRQMEMHVLPGNIHDWPDFVSIDNVTSSISANFNEIMSSIIHCYCEIRTSTVYIQRCTSPTWAVSLITLATFCQRKCKPRPCYRSICQIGVCSLCQCCASVCWRLVIYARMPVKSNLKYLGVLLALVLVCKECCFSLVRSPSKWCST